MNRLKVFGIVAMIASIGLLMTGCLTAADRKAAIAPLVGTWSNAWDTLVFDANGRFQMTWSSGDGGQMSGSFTVRRGNIFLSPLGGDTFTGSYSLVGDNLHISVPAWQWVNGILSREVHVYNYGPFIGAWSNPWDAIVLNANGTFQMTWSSGGGGQMSGVFIANNGDISLTPRGRQTYTGTYSVLDEDTLRISVPGWQWNNAILSRQ